jgi:hypothetical protein
MQAPAPSSSASGVNVAAILAMNEAALIAVLQDAAAPLYAKAKACQRLALVGGRDAVPALAKLLADPKLNTYARYGLEPIRDEAVDAALRNALATLSGNPRQGVMNSIGRRRDAKAVKAVAKLLGDRDVETARTAAATLAKIGNPEAAKELEKAFPRTTGPLHDTVAQSGVICIENLKAAGHAKEAAALAAALRKGPLPKPVQIALG